MMWKKIKDWWSTRAGNPRHMAEIFSGLHSLFSDMKEKDAELFHKVGSLPISEAWRRWKETYPEDFPNGGLTSVTDRTAIKPK